MNQVITIHLNGRAFQVEEPGWKKLSEYLAEAGNKLASDPDKQEILSDFEQAIGEKLERFLTQHKTVIMEQEVTEVLKEMGPVQGENSGQQSAEQSARKAAPAGKRLYKIREGAMISGVCMGLAAYFETDVTLIRLLAVILFLLTHGVMILAYILMAVILPKAKTSAEYAAAYGEPFTAQDVINRAKEEYSRFTSSDERRKWKQEYKKWKREFKNKMRQERWQQKAEYCAHSGLPWGRTVFGLLITIVSIAWLVGLVTLLSHGVVFGWIVPANFPIWAALVVWLCVYNLVVWPLKAWRRAWRYPSPVCQGCHHGLMDFLAWVALWALVGWLVWRYVPAVHPYMQQAADWLNRTAASLRH